jgi:hypothetical protein
MDQVLKEDRLLCKNFPADWGKFNFGSMVQEPEGISVDDVYKGVNYVKGRIYSFPVYQVRMLKSFLNLRGSRGSIYFSYKFNKVLRDAYLHAHYHAKVKRLR